MLSDDPTLEELAAALGLDEKALAKTVERAGSRSVARAKLRKRVNARDRAIERELERRRAEERARDARERHAVVRAEERDETNRSRKSRTLADRLHRVLTDLQLASTQPGATGHVGSRTAPDSHEPPAQALPAIGWRVEAIRFQIERLEHELDAIHGKEAATELTGAQKDAVIVLRFPGVHSTDVADAAPELGSRRTIERVRSRNKLRPTTGLPFDDDDQTTQTTQTTEPEPEPEPEPEGQDTQTTEDTAP